MSCTAVRYLTDLQVCIKTWSMVTDGGVIFEEFIPGYNTNLLHQCNFGRSSRGHVQSLPSSWWWERRNRRNYYSKELSNPKEKLGKKACNSFMESKIWLNLVLKEISLKIISDHNCRWYVLLISSTSSFACVYLCSNKCYWVIILKST